MAKKIKVLDNVSGVEQIINVSSLASNGTITGTDLMLIEQSNTLKKVSITDLSAEFGGGSVTGAENNTVRFNATGDLEETSIVVVRDNGPGDQTVEFYADYITNFGVTNLEETTNVCYDSGTLNIGNVNLVGTGNPGIINIYNPNNVIEINYATDSTENLILSIENTKATLEDGDILVYNTANSTFKVDNISNYAGTGNYHVLKVEFAGGSEYETETIIPEGALLQQMYLYRSTALTTGTPYPLTFSIDGTSPLNIATQGTDFNNDAGGTILGWFFDDDFRVVGSGESGKLKSSWIGSGTGAGYAYLFYWTPLP